MCVDLQDVLVRPEEAAVHRGLANPLGANNCFLNATLQNLWHSPPFRRALSSFAPKAPAGSLVGLLQALFARFETLESDDPRDDQGTLSVRLPLI